MGGFWIGGNVQWATLRCPTLMINFLLKLITIHLLGWLQTLWQIFDQHWGQVELVNVVLVEAGDGGLVHHGGEQLQGLQPQAGRLVVASDRHQELSTALQKPGQDLFVWCFKLLSLSHKLKCFSIFPTSDSSPSPPSQGRPRGTLQTAPPRINRASSLNWANHQ